MRRTPHGHRDGRLPRRFRPAIQRLEARELLAVVLVAGGFEAPVQGSNAFTYAPSGSAWTFSGGAGLAANNSAFASGSQPAPQGQQAAFIQQTGTISQDVAGWDAGSYHIIFAAALRYGSSQDDFQVLVDDNVVGTFQPQTGANYLYYTTPAFAVTAGDHTVTFRANNTHGGDNTVLLDASAITPATAGVPIINDPGFEQAPVAAGGYTYDPQDSYWDFGGTAGVSGDGSGFTVANPNAPDGSHVAFLQGQGSLIQSVTDWSSATYQVSFEAAQRGTADQHSRAARDGRPALAAGLPGPARW